MLLSTVKLFLSHWTALRLWRLLRIRGVTPPSSRLNRIEDCACRKRQLADCGISLSPLAVSSRVGCAELETALADPASGAARLDLLVGERSSISNLRNVKHHLLEGTLPPDAFRLVSDGIYLPSPELVFLLLASELSRLRRIALAYELVGSYALDRPSTNGFVSGLSPVTSLDRLRDFLARSTRRRHAARALADLELVHERSASPRETDLAMAFSLPAGDGGYGLGPFSMNPVLRFEGERAVLAGGVRRYPDILFVRDRVVVEYDSDQWHGGVMKPSVDKDRADGLSAVGYTVLTFTNLHFGSYASFSRQMLRLVGHLGEGLAGEDEVLASARRRLFVFLRSPDRLVY